MRSHPTIDPELRRKIIHPHDLGITAAIEANLEPKCWEVSTVRRSALCLDVTSQMKAAYFDAILSLSQTRYISHLQSIPIFFSSLTSYLQRRDSKPSKQYPSNQVCQYLDAWSRACLCRAGLENICIPAFRCGRRTEATGPGVSNRQIS